MFYTRDFMVWLIVCYCHRVIYEGVFIAPLTHWGRVAHICFRKLTSIGSDNGLSPDLRQAIVETNAGIFLIGIQTSVKF